MGHSLNGTSIPRKQAGFDTSAEADGQRAYMVGLPLSANPHQRGYAQARSEAWARGWKQQQQRPIPKEAMRH